MKHLLGIVAGIGLGLGLIYATFSQSKSGKLTQTLPERFAEVAAELPAAEARAKAAGLPASWSEFAPNPPIPVAENGAPLVRTALDQFRVANQGGVSNRIQAQVNQGDRADQAVLEKDFTVFDPAFQTLTEALKRPKFNWDRQWGIGPVFQILFPEYAEIKTVVKTLAIRATHQIRQGQMEAGRAEFSLAWKLAEVCLQEEFLFTGLMQIACQEIVARQMELSVTARPRMPICTPLWRRSCRPMRRPYHC